jgi:preprotein translocase subunit SecG
MVILLFLLMIIVSILLMAVVLLQSSKGNGLAGPIGGASVTMAFGVRRTSDVLSKSTTVLAVILLVGCIVINLLIGNKGTIDESIIQKNAGQQQQQMPPQNIPPPENNPPPGNENQNQNKDQQQQKQEQAPIAPPVQEK